MTTGRQTQNLKRENGKSRPQNERPVVSRQNAVNRTHISLLQAAVEQPERASWESIQALQRLYGNRAVSQLVQTKPAVDGTAGEEIAHQTAEATIGATISLTDGQGGDRVQRIPLTEDQWTHIARGEIRWDNKKPRVVGYHWTKDAKAVAEKTGENAEGPNDLGVYVEGVQSKDEHPPTPGKKAQKIKKDKASTFWPDSWSEADIRDVIANTTTTIKNNTVEVTNKTAKQEAVGMKLFVNPDSVFPVYVPTEEEGEGKGRGGKGGRKKY